MAELIQGALARVLEERRSRFNTLFAEARRVLPQLDADAFSTFLRATIAPALDAVAGVAPDRIGEVGEVLFEVALELIGKDLLNKHPSLATGLPRLLSGLPGQLAEDPRGLASAITNALCYFSQVAGARPEEWIDAVLRIGRDGVKTSVLLEAGQVAAWRAGMAHFRQGSLAICERLEPRIVCDVLGVPDNVGNASVEAVINQLRVDPWFDPGNSSGKKVLQIVGRVGGFRGFGGPFVAPPRVAFVDGQFLVDDGDSCRLLIADRFGASFHRTSADFPKRTKNPDGPFRIERKGRVTCGKETGFFEELRDFSSAAADATTLAVTLPHSHFVNLVAMTEEAP
jgi:hypothetical protein